MKIRTRLVIAFLTITLIPIILTTTMGIVLCKTSDQLNRKDIWSYGYNLGELIKFYAGIVKSN